MLHLIRQCKTIKTEDGLGADTTETTEHESRGCKVNMVDKQT